MPGPGKGFAMNIDLVFFQTRAAQEAARVNAANDPRVRTAHERLRDAYLKKVVALRAADDTGLHGE